MLHLLNFSIVKLTHHAMKRWFLFLFVFIGFSYTSAQERHFRIVEYNVENLFDTIHCEGKQDADFTPQGAYQWNTSKYWSKLGKLARIIAGASGASAAEVVGLIEVENDSVIYDLTQRTKLKRMGYAYIMTHSADERGINVALLYQSARFRPFHTESIRVAPINKKQRPTRDVLHVAGEMFTGDTLDLFLCHFPSKKGGHVATNYRYRVAQRLKQKADSVMHVRHTAHLFIMGDFNAYYPEKIFKEVLKATPISSIDSIMPQKLYLLTDQMKASHDIEGTYKYQGQWDQLDNFIVNGTLLNKQGIYIDKRSCKIVDFPYMLQKDKKGDGVHPYRTFLGTYYQGGYSDHLPIILDITFP